MKTPHVLISASAGSGKTYRLVHHFIGIVYGALLAPGQDRQPDVVDRILAATFTRAAAGEIIERILRRLAEAMLMVDVRAALGNELGCVLSKEQCGVMLAAVVTKLHRLRVSTLDSFFIRSAQAFAAELGLPADWTIIDDAINHTIMLEAIDRLLTDAAADEQTFQPMVDLIVGLHDNRFPLQVRQRLIKHLRDTAPAYFAGPPEAWEVIRPQEGHLLAESSLAALAGGLPVHAEPFIPRTQKGGLYVRWVNAIKNAADNLGGRSWAELLDSALIQRLTAEAPEFDGKPFPRQIIQLLTPCRNHAAACMLQLLYDRNLATRALLGAFMHHYRQGKARRSAYRFNDFTQMLLEAHVTESLADFYFRLDATIDHALLDEFQDTSIPQWKLMHPLVDEIMAGGEGRGEAGQRTFFCVGDVKQTLYGWRNAEPQLLGELTTIWPDLKVVSEKMSRRSAPVVIQTLNDVFGTMTRNAALLPKDADSAYLAEAAATWAGWFEKHETVQKELSGFCRLITCGDGEDIKELEEAAVQTAVARVRELHQIDPTKEIAILVRRRKFISPLLGYLRKSGVRAAGEGGSPLADDMAVCTVLSLLHLIDHPSDSAAAFHVGSSPLGEALGIVKTPVQNDLLRKTGALRAEILDRGLGATINRWFGLCAARCDARNFRRLQRLIEVAHGYRYDGGNLRPFIDTIRATNVEDSEESKVRVMTIHASKGREFDYVILPDLDAKFGRMQPAVLLNRPSLLADADCITTYPNKTPPMLDERLTRMSSEAKRRQVEEELCSLYVAMTRAKSGLEMIIHPPKPSSSGALPVSHAGVLLGALRRDGGQPNSVLWTQAHSRLPATTAAEAMPVSAPPKPTFVKIAPAGTASRLRPIVAPSAIEGSGFTHLSRTLTFSESRAMDWGLVLHHWFKLIDWTESPPPTDAALRHAAGELDLDIPPAQLVAIITQFRQACAGPNISRLLSRSHYLAATSPGTTVELWRERAFAVPMAIPDMASTAVVSGRIDRAVLLRVDGHVTSVDIADIKTDRVSGSALRDRIAQYTPQLRAYGRAVAQLAGVDASRVSMRLAFVAIDTVIDIPPEPGKIAVPAAVSLRAVSPPLWQASAKPPELVQELDQKKMEFKQSLFD